MVKKGILKMFLDICYFLKKTKNDTYNFIKLKNEKVKKKNMVDYTFKKVYDISNNSIINTVIGNSR